MIRRILCWLGLHDYIGFCARHKENKCCQNCKICKYDRIICANCGKVKK